MKAKGEGMELWKDASFWAVGTDAWGNIITCDPCDSREEAEDFCRDELHGRGIVMTRKELLTAIDMGEEVCA